MNLAKCCWSMGLALATALGGTLTCAQEHSGTTPLPAGAHFVERELRLPLRGSGSAGLDAIEVYINTPGKHPLALLTHGTSNDARVRAHVSPWAYLPQARWFAERGYVALVIVRRGYGSSGGEMDGTHGGCNSNGSFEATGAASAEDLRNAANYAQQSMPEVDATRVVSAGVSTGGFAQVALTADPPPGLKVAISFAGGRGGDGNGHLCNESGFEAALHTFGKRSRIPMLWIYAENDKWFPPNFAHKFLASFQLGGGNAQFVLAPPDGIDGHSLFSHPDAWSNTVQNFLGARRLLPVDPPYPAPPVPNAQVPAGLGESGLTAFKLYLTLAPNKAFATNGKSWYGYSSAEASQQEADSVALDNCNNVRRGGPACFIVYRGDNPANSRSPSTTKPGTEPVDSGIGGKRAGPQQKE